MDTGEGVDRHIKILAILFIAMGVISTLVSLVCLVLVLVGLVFEGDPKAFMIVGDMWTVYATLVMSISIPGIIVGYGLLKRYHWARIGSIIFAVLSLADIPVGTAIGIYALWVLLKPETVLLFSHGPGSQPVPSENTA